MGATFEWDPAKNEANRRKHGVSFREAISAFMDPFSVTILTRTTRLRRRGFSCSARTTGASCWSFPTQTGKIAFES
jgi:hypothetical protein